MKDLDKFEEMFMVFASSLGQFGSEIEEANFKNEVGLISFSTARKLEELYNEVEEDIRKARAFDNMKTRMK
jgi:hypothetical protein